MGGSVTGDIENIGDEDWFRADLEAGKTYQIDQKGADGGGGTLTDPFLDNIRDSSGTEIDDTFNDDVDFENDIFDSQIIFTPTAAGTYYLVASRNGNIGTYTLSVRDIGVTDDDVPIVSVSFEQGTYTVAEGGSVTITVNLSADPERTVRYPQKVCKQSGGVPSV